MNAIDLTTYNAESQASDWRRSVFVPPGEAVPNVSAGARAFESLSRVLCGGGVRGMALPRPSRDGTALYPVTSAPDTAAYDASCLRLLMRTLQTVEPAARGRLRTDLGHAYDPPRVLCADLPPRPGLEDDLAWLKAHAERYRGQWVALSGGELVAAADTGSELGRRISTRRGLHIVRLF